MKWATLTSLSLHALGAVGAYCLYPSGRGEEGDISPIQIEFVYTPSSVPATLSSPSAQKPKQRHSKTQKVSSKPLMADGQILEKPEQGCNSSCQGGFRASAHNVSPSYPTFARERGVEGEGLFRLTLDARGHVIKVELIQGKMESILLEEALKTLSTWRFHGKVPPFVDVPIQFRLLN